MQALIQRQKTCFDAAVSSGDKLRLDALATAPFTTGLGNEHPLENGFAFLNPYGLPYLPASGVKGVLRQAARELASGQWGDSHGWDAILPSPFGRGAGGEGCLSVINILFGLKSRDGDTEHQRGVLSFWDVIPQIKGDSLMVEIMTPHQAHYYQQKKDRKSGDSTNPHDSGQPTPISFLTVPPGAEFAFHVVCDLARLKRLAPELAKEDAWKKLTTTALEHAFAWLGFGAKTAVGYGAMESGLQRQARAEDARQLAEAEKEKQKAEAAKQREADAVEWQGARIKFNKANSTLTVEKDDKTAYAIAPRGKELLDSLPADIRNKVETNQYVKATARVSGTQLLGVSA